MKYKLLITCNKEEIYLNVGDKDIINADFANNIDSLHSEGWVTTLIVSERYYKLYNMDDHICKRVFEKNNEEIVITISEVK